LMLESLRSDLNGLDAISQKNMTNFSRPFDIPWGWCYSVTAASCRLPTDYIFRP